jgi:NTP pyrophosphatase (non-canonical NTP hydrolase)
VEASFITFSAYQDSTSTTATYPDLGTGSLFALSYCTLGLAGEAGEVANKVKKMLRDGDSPAKRAELVGEIGDCLWYISQLCSELKLSMSDVAAKNIDKLSDRKKRGVIGGNGDNR